MSKTEKQRLNIAKYLDIAKIKKMWSEYKHKDLAKVGIALVIIFFTIMHVRGCIKNIRKHAVMPRPVKMVVAVQKDVDLYLDTFGTLSALNDVNITSQVTGKIKEIDFKEGQDVKAGDLLFVIDPDPYKADLEKAEAALAEDMVDAKLKRDTYERNKSLYEQKLISQQDYEQYDTDALAAEAKVKSDMAAVDLAKINLDYCYIKSPVDGVTGKRQIDLGNLVIANSTTPLVNVKTIDQLYLDFTIPETDLQSVRKAIAADVDGKLKVAITVEGDTDGPYEARLDSLNNTVDEDTGTISLRAIAPNFKRALWAGQFVQVRLILGTEKNAVLVPYEAVQIGQQGTYAFVVTPKNKADLRVVTTGTRDGDNIVIEKGIEEGEKVVTMGVLALAPGVPVISMEELQKYQAKKAHRH